MIFRFLESFTAVEKESNNCGVYENLLFLLNLTSTVILTFVKTQLPFGIGTEDSKHIQTIPETNSLCAHPQTTLKGKNKDYVWALG